jgi:hypothetical protein
MSSDAFGAEDMYLSLTHWGGGPTSTLALYELTNGVATLMAAINPNVFTSTPQRGDAIGSTIRASISLATWGISATSTAHTGLRGGVFVFRSSEEANRSASGFSAFDGGSNTPTISSVSPSTGPTAGGTAIVISGTNFDASATSQTGGNANTSVQVYSDIEIRAVTPAGTAGAKNVSVTTAAGTGTLAGGFTYPSPSSDSLPPKCSVSVGVSL